MAQAAATLIARILLAAAPFSSKASHTKQRNAPDVKDDLKNKKNCWLQCTIRNTTEFELLADSSYFNSSRYADHTGSVDPFSLCIFTCCEGDNTFMTGVSGGKSFQINIDADYKFEFSIGLTTPYAGSSKAGVVASGNASDGYKNASQEECFIETPKCEGREEDGNPVKFKLHISAATSQRPQFGINEIRDH